MGGREREREKLSVVAACAPTFVGVPHGSDYVNNTQIASKQLRTHGFALPCTARRAPAASADGQRTGLSLNRPLLTRGLSGWAQEVIRKRLFPLRKSADSGFSIIRRGAESQHMLFTHGKLTTRLIFRGARGHLCACGIELQCCPLQ